MHLLVLTAALASLVTPTWEVNIFDCPDQATKDTLKDFTMTDIKSEVLDTFTEYLVSQPAFQKYKSVDMKIEGNSEPQFATMTLTGWKGKVAVKPNLKTIRNADGSFTLRKPVPYTGMSVFVAKIYILFKTENVVGYFFCGNDKLVGFSEELAVAVRKSKLDANSNDMQKTCEDVETAKTKLLEIGLEKLKSMDKKLTVCDEVQAGKEDDQKKDDVTVAESGKADEVEAAKEPNSDGKEIEAESHVEEGKENSPETVAENKEPEAS